MDIRHRETINKRKETIRMPEIGQQTQEVYSFEHQQLKRKKKRSATRMNSKHKYPPSMKTAAWRGNPLGSNTPTSVVVRSISFFISRVPKYHCHLPSTPPCRCLWGGLCRTHKIVDNMQSSMWHNGFHVSQVRHLILIEMYRQTPGGIV